MKKKILPMFLVTVMSASLFMTGCGNSDNSASSGNSTNSGAENEDATDGDSEEYEGEVSGSSDIKEYLTSAEQKEHENATDVLVKYQDGVLIIYGKGYCDTIDSTISTVIEENRDDIKKLVLLEGITGILQIDDMPNLAEIELADTVEKVGTIKNMDSLETLILPQNVEQFSGVTDCNNLTTLELPCAADVVRCNALKELYMPYSGENSFLIQDNESLEKLEFGEGYTEIDTRIFPTNPNLKEVILPSTVMVIGNGTFKDVVNLETVSMQEGIETIGDYAFAGCTNLKNISLPSTVKEIGVGAFQKCTSLESISVPEGVTQLLGNGNAGVFSQCTSLKNVELPSTLTELGHSAFLGCTSLEEIVLPDGVTNFGVQVFDECPNVVIHGKAGSAAQTFAEENDYPFQAK